MTRHSMPSTKNISISLLAIETSCDETAIALIKASRNRRFFRVLSSIIFSQIPLHQEWGGVVPHIAKREHQRNLVPLLLQALEKSKSKDLRSKIYYGRKKQENKNLKSILEREPELLTQFEKHLLHFPRPNIDLIAVTEGPGLEPALWVGVNFARALSMWWNVPLIGINHMEGHIASALLKQSRRSLNFPAQSVGKQKLQATHYPLQTIIYPALALLVSGGHTELVLMRKSLKYEIIGETRDDAAGEAFDKVARILGLGYPGGPAIAAEAQQSEVRLPKIVGSRTSDCLSLPRPMIHTKDFDFSFSGLKTAVLYLVRDLEKQGINMRQLRPTIAKEFQDAVVDVLVAKTIRAACQYKAKTILLGGGVAANVSLQETLTTAIKKNLPNSKFYIPNSNLAGDNALMIAAVAYIKFLHDKKLLTQKSARTLWKTLKPHAHLRLE